MHLVAIKDNVEIAALLLRHGADLEATDNRKRTPLHRAVDSTSPKMVEWLLRQGSKYDAEDGDDQTPIDVAVRKAKEPVLQSFRYYHLIA